MKKALEKLRESFSQVEGAIWDEEHHANLTEDGDIICLMTDDFTPEQALTRMAYKIHGEII